MNQSQLETNTWDRRQAKETRAGNFRLVDNVVLVSQTNH